MSLFLYKERCGVMAKGNKPLQKKDDIIASAKLRCLRCGNLNDNEELYDSDSALHEFVGKIPYCRSCLDEIYQDYFKKYKSLNYLNPDRKAIERICMALDIYYSDKIFDSAVKVSAIRQEATLLALYLTQAKLYQYRKKNYDNTIQEKFEKTKDDNGSMSVHTKRDKEQDGIIKEASKFFGTGFSDEDYLFLQEQYADWTTRHECQTKAQEEIFKRICFKQLEILKWR